MAKKYEEYLSEYKIKAGKEVRKWLRKCEKTEAALNKKVDEINQRADKLDEEKV